MIASTKQFSASLVTLLGLLLAAQPARMLGQVQVKTFGKIECVMLDKPDADLDIAKWFRDFEALERSDAGDYQERILGLASPWINRIVAKPYGIDLAENMKIAYCKDMEIGDVFLLQYDVSNTKVSIIDTSTAVLISFKNIDIPSTEGLDDALRNWQTFTRRYLNFTEAWISPTKLICIKANSAVGYNPQYKTTANELPAQRDVWWPHSAYKIASGEYCARIFKQNGGPDPAEKLFGLRHRLEDYSQLVAAMGPAELSVELKNANEYEYHRIVSSFDTQKVSTSDVFVMLLEGQGSDDLVPPRSPIFFYGMFGRSKTDLERRDLLYTLFRSFEGKKVSEKGLDQILRRLSALEVISAETLAQISKKPLQKSSQEKISMALKMLEQSKKKQIPMAAE